MYDSLETAEDDSHSIENRKQHVLTKEAHFHHGVFYIIDLILYQQYLFYNKFDINSQFKDINIQFWENNINICDTSELLKARNGPDNSYSLKIFAMLSNLFFIPIWCCCMERSSMHIQLKISYASQRRESHIGLEWQEGETKCNFFGWAISFLIFVLYELKEREYISNTFARICRRKGRQVTKQLGRTQAVPALIGRGLAPAPGCPGTAGEQVQRTRCHMGGKSA